MSEKTFLLVRIQTNGDFCGHDCDGLVRLLPKKYVCSIFVENVGKNRYKSIRHKKCKNYQLE